MAETTVPRAPSGLGRAGRALWKRITASFELEAHEYAILVLACRQADDLAALEELVEREGLSVPGSQGQPTLHRAVIEVRQGRMALARLIGELGIPDSLDVARTVAGRRAQAAANSRWRRKARERDRGLELVEDQSG